MVRAPWLMDGAEEVVFGPAEVLISIWVGKDGYKQTAVAEGEPEPDADTAAAKETKSTDTTETKSADSADELAQSGVAASTGMEGGCILKLSANFKNVVWNTNSAGAPIAIEHIVLFLSLNTQDASPFKLGLHVTVPLATLVALFSQDKGEGDIGETIGSVTSGDSSPDDCEDEHAHCLSLDIAWFDEEEADSFDAVVMDESFTFEFKAYASSIPDPTH